MNNSLFARMPFWLKRLAPLLLLTFVSACGDLSKSDSSVDYSEPPLVATKPEAPNQGLYLGALLLTGQTSIAQFNAKTGVKHALFAEFLQFPRVLDTNDSEYGKIVSFIKECKANGAQPMLTLETPGGLASYTRDQIVAFADFLYNSDVSIFLRWNHEMNGSWYAWGQQPTLFIAKFREFADIIHARAPNVAMAWTPNQAWGYPWPTTPSRTAPGSADFALLDTNKDGVITDADDPYTPYYPGDAYVDWVGHSFYHWSNRSARGYNEIPYAGKWGQANGIGNSVPNFHDLFAVGHNKPMMIAETSALFDPLDKNGGGAGEADIKTGWLGQVYNLSDSNSPSLRRDFPKLKAIFWFSQKKYEPEVGTDIDWQLDSNQTVSDHYRRMTLDSYFIKGK